jgi:hypothetical protein
MREEEVDLPRCILGKTDDGLAEAEAIHPRQAVTCARTQLSDALIAGIGFSPRQVELLCGLSPVRERSRLRTSERP